MCFAFDEMGEEGDVVPVLNGCELGEVVEVFSDEGEFEVVDCCQPDYLTGYFPIYVVMGGHRFPRLRHR